MLLYNIDKETMIKVISKSKIISYKSNEIIFYQNSTPFNLYLVLTGEISLKKYSNLDLLTMIGSETNITLSKRYSDSKYRNSKMSRQSMQTMRNSAFKNYQENININRLTCGDFFYEENLVTKTPYEYCTVVEKNAFVLAVNLNVFNSYLKKNISRTMENIKELIQSRFQYFKQVERNTFKSYMDNITKLFPKNGDIICKENEPSDKLYLIYQGKFAVQKNSKNLGNLIYLNKGDIFGYESLINLKPKIETETKIDVEINIKKNEYDIVNKDNTSIILCLDIPFFDELTTWKLSKNLLNYFKEQKDIIHNFEKIKYITALIFEEKYKNLSKKKRRIKSLNRNKNIFTKDKNYRFLFKTMINSQNNYSIAKITNKRKVNFLNNHIKVLPKDYFKNIIQKYKLRDSFSIHKERKNNYVSHLFNNLGRKSIIINQKNNLDNIKCITPIKKLEVLINKNISLKKTNEYSRNKSTEKKSTSSSLISNFIGVNNNSNSSKSSSGKRPISVINKDKVSSFDSFTQSTQYKSRSRMKTTLFQYFMSNNKIAIKNITTKKKKNKIFFRNGNLCSNFDISKNWDKNNPICILSYLNSKPARFNLTDAKEKSIEKRHYVSKYNFPYIYEEKKAQILL